MSTRYRVHESNVAWRVADDEAVVLHADSSAYFGLNETGTQVWVQLAEYPMTLDKLTTWARSVFDVSGAGLATDLATFVNELIKLDLIAGDEDAGAAAADERPTVAPATGRRLPWTTPAVERFGALEKLILSSE